MKTVQIRTALAALIILVCFGVSEADDSLRPVTVSQVVGDTLDRFESKRYGVFGEYPGYQYATFTMGSDSTLYAKIITESRDKIDSEVVDCGPAQEYIEKNFSKSHIGEPSWAKSAYIAVGTGGPLGQKYEVGLNIGGHLGLGLIARGNDTWSNGGGQAALGFRIIGPFLISRLAPYFSLETGSSMSLFGTSDTYKNYSLGLAVTATRWLQVRSEVGSASTSKYVSGGPGFFGDTGPLVMDHGSFTSFNMALEIDLNGIF